MIIVRYASGESEQKYACNVLNQPISPTLLALDGDRRIGSLLRIGNFGVFSHLGPVSRRSQKVFAPRKP